MTTYGPWVQPADASASLTNQYRRKGFTTAFGMAGSAHGVLYGDTADGATIVDTTADSHSTAATEFAGDSPWLQRLGLIAWDIAGASYPPVPPSPAELAQPRVVGYQVETPNGVPRTTGALTLSRGSGPMTDTAFTETVYVEGRHATSGFTVSPADFSWWTPLQLSAMPLLASFPVIGSPSPTTTPLTSVAGTFGVVMDINLAASESPPASAFDVAAWIDATLSMDYQPPRYRLVYDVLAPLRQFPRDDALGGQQRQFGSRSVQSSTRSGWSGAYR